MMLRRTNSVSSLVPIYDMVLVLSTFMLGVALFTLPFARNGVKRDISEHELLHTIGERYHDRGVEPGEEFNALALKSNLKILKHQSNANSRMTGVYYPSRILQVDLIE